jgi:predicted RNA binding protein YcfA (HicA-like mRNA interferase family)
MSRDEIEKLLNFTIKSKELEVLLLRLGFQKKTGKGSHVKWVKKGLPPIVVATHSKEIKPYQVKQVIQVLRIGGLL